MIVRDLTSNQLFAGLIVVLTAWVFSGYPDYLRLTYSNAPPPVLHALFLVVLLIIQYYRSSSFRIGDGVRRIFSNTPILTWFLLFIIIGYLSIVVHGYNDFARMDLGRRISAALFFLMFMFCVTENRIRYLVMHGIAAGGIVLGITILLGALQLAFITPHTCRMGGLYLNANGAAYALVCSLWVGSHAMASSRYKTIFQAFMVFCVALTLSRSGFLALVVALFFLTVQRHLALLRLGALTLALAFGFAAAASFQGELQRGSCLFAAIEDRFGAYFGEGGPKSSADVYEPVQIYEPVQLDHSASERLLLAKQALKKFQENPLIGSGIDAVEGERSHNQLLAFMSQHGIFGILIYFAFFAIFYRAGVPVSLLTPLFVISLFDHNFFYSKFILAALAIGLYYGVRHRQPLKSASK